MKGNSTLGNGFQEVIYQRALDIKMGNQGLKYQREFLIILKIKILKAMNPKIL
jgi:hypothetical protein